MTRYQRVEQRRRFGRLSGLDEKVGVRRRAGRHGVRIAVSVALRAASRAAGRLSLARNRTASNE
jgi:hypothetical protein